MNKNHKTDWELIKKISDVYSDHRNIERFSVERLQTMLQSCYDTMEKYKCDNVSYWIFTIERKPSANPDIPVCIVTINEKIDYWFEK